MPKKKPAWDPKSWASLSPNGLGHQKPNHYADMMKVIRENRDSLPYAWNILNNGVCDGCALGVSGLKDWTVEGPHLCTIRLNLLRMNTMPAFDPTILADVAPLERKKGNELRELGRLPYPMLRRSGEKGFTRISWDEALDLAAEKIRNTDPNRLAIYMTSRGITNEAYYVTQKAARFLGTNNIDNASRVCHAPSTVALKESLGVTASTCSYGDWIGSDLVVLVGSDLANNQPVSTKYLYYAKKQGTKVVVINPYREPGLDNYWIPSITESAVFGTKIMDDFFGIHTGGDIPFLNGVLKRLIEIGGVDETWVAQHADGFETLKAKLDEQSWEELAALSGASYDDMDRFARMYAEAKTAVFVWSMGITQHRYGVQNVQAIINLALARGMVGREKCGLMPIRGHSGVQGSAECGAVPNTLPGGTPVSSPEADRLARLWGFDFPRKPGMAAVQMIEAAANGDLDVLYSIGGNFVETLPEPKRVIRALEKIPLRIHQDIVLNSSMFIPAKEAVLLLPAQTRYEQAGGVTETTTERRILFSPHIPGHEIGEAKPEWEIPMEIGERVRPDRAPLIHFNDTAEIREELGQANLNYAGIEKLSQQGDGMQWGGPRLCEGGTFKTPDGKAHFQPLDPPESAIPPGQFYLSTRRGKQFNSMVQGEKDPLTGGKRDAVFLATEDAERLGLSQGDRVMLRSPVGEMAGTAHLVPIKPRNVQVFWPEGNVLLQSGACDPVCHIPDYNTYVELEKEE
ncbi:MAG: FdhF/YdeP family oxidoreductase [Armatimonadetes bacterium]|nr:FdhF/YdeP family oxidoreductase [Armatimonadota bacterium]